MNDHPNAAATVDDPAVLVARIESLATTLTTNAGGTAMTWRAWGAGEPLVLLHGGYGSWLHWIRNIEGLARAYRVLIPDMPGYGDSPLPAGIDSLSEFARIIATGLDQLIPDGKPYRLVAFSFGSAVATHLLAFQQSRIRRLVIVGTSGLGPRKMVREEMQRWRDMPTAEARNEAHRHNLGVLMIHDKSKIDALAVYLQSRNTERARTRHGSLKASGDRKQLMLAHPVPLAGLWGGKDAMSEAFMTQRAAALREIDPHADIRVIPDAGHWVQYEAPAAFNDALLDLLRN